MTPLSPSVFDGCRSCNCLLIPYLSAEHYFPQMVFPKDSCLRSSMFHALPSYLSSHLVKAGRGYICYLIALERLPSSPLPGLSRLPLALPLHLAARAWSVLSFFCSFCLRLRPPWRPLPRLSSFFPAPSSLDPLKKIKKPPNAAFRAVFPFTLFLPPAEVPCCAPSAFLCGKCGSDAVGPERTIPPPSLILRCFGLHGAQSTPFSPAGALEDHFCRYSSLPSSIRSLM